MYGGPVVTDRDWLTHSWVNKIDHQWFRCRLIACLAMISVPMLAYILLDLWEHISVNIWTQKIQRKKWNWGSRLHNGSHFVSAPMFTYESFRWQAKCDTQTKIKCFHLVLSTFHILFHFLFITICHWHFALYFCSFIICISPFILHNVGAHRISYMNLLFTWTFAPICQSFIHHRAHVSLLPFKICHIHVWLIYLLCTTPATIIRMYWQNNLTRNSCISICIRTLVSWLQIRYIKG